MLELFLMAKAVTQKITKRQPDLPLYEDRECVNALKALAGWDWSTTTSRGTSASCGKQVCSRSKNMGGNASMSYRKESGAAAHTHAYWILAVAASSSIIHLHGAVAEDGVGGAASLQQAASLLSPGVRKINAVAASPFDSICQSCTFNGVSSPRRNTLP
jgi:hypothetical protein